MGSICVKEDWYGYNLFNIGLNSYDHAKLEEKLLTSSVFDVTK